MVTLANSVNPLFWNVPIVNTNGTPTLDFQRKWAQQAATNASIPNLTTATAVSAVLDLLGGTVGDLLVRGTQIWSTLAPNTAGFVLTDNGPGATPTWQKPGAPASALDDGTNFYLAMQDASGQLVLDSNGDPIFAPEMLPANAVPLTVPTTQTLTTTGTYTPTSAAVKWIKVRMVGGGGAGAGAGSLTGDGSNGSGGGDTIFNGVHAAGGATGGHFGGGGSGGSAGSGTANFRAPGECGDLGYTYSANLIANQATPGSVGGSSQLGGASGNGASAAANTGAGGGGGHLTDPGTANTTGIDGGGGGSGEYVELILAAASYAFTIGTGGTGGLGGTRGSAGGNGGSGVIWVEEYYI